MKYSKKFCGALAHNSSFVDAQINWLFVKLSMITSSTRRIDDVCCIFCFVWLANGSIFDLKKVAIVQIFTENSPSLATVIYFCVETKIKSFFCFKFLIARILKWTWEFIQHFNIPILNWVSFEMLKKNWDESVSSVMNIANKSLVVCILARSGFYDYIYVVMKLFAWIFVTFVFFLWSTLVERIRVMFNFLLFANRFITIKNWPHTTWDRGNFSLTWPL